jgi:proteasome lid subunit RPN8/RPN11
VTVHPPLALVAARVWGDLEAFMAHRRPAEACGAFVYWTRPLVFRVVRAVEIPNRARNRMAGFAFGRVDWLEACRRLEPAPGQRVGVFHSHGLGPARPSLPDRLLISALGRLHLIASPADGLTVWRPVKGHIEEVSARVLRR